MPNAVLIEMLESLRGLTKQAGISETLAGLGLIGAGLGLPLAYRQGKGTGREETLEDEKVKRLLAFGSGALTGYVAPKLLNKLTEKRLGILDAGDMELPPMSQLPGIYDIPELSNQSLEYS